MVAISGGGYCKSSIVKDGKPKGFVYMVKNMAEGDNAWEIYCDSTVDQICTAIAMVFCNPAGGS